MGRQSLAEVNSSTQEETQKQRKKQAKQEAKIMLKMEQAKKDAQKNEQKVSKAVLNFQAASARLHALEEKLTAIRTPQAESQDDGMSSISTDYEYIAISHSTEGDSIQGQEAILPEDTHTAQDESQG